MITKYSGRLVEVFIFGVCGCVAASQGDAQLPDPTSPAIIELFTSQGCSSCPAAEEILSELQGQNVIALAYHVDYWDSKQWRDRFAMSLSSTRQQGYVKALALSTAFTPQVIVGGSASFVGSDGSSIVKAASRRAVQRVPIKTRLTQDALEISLPANPSHAPLDINLVSYLSSAVTKVTGGENSGRMLHEFDVVRNFSKLGVYIGASQELRIPLQALPSDADSVAVFLQEGDQGAIQAAVTMALHNQAQHTSVPNF